MKDYNIIVIIDMTLIFYITRLHWNNKGSIGLRYRIEAIYVRSSLGCRSVLVIRQADENQNFLNPVL